MVIRFDDKGFEADNDANEGELTLEIPGSCTTLDRSDVTSLAIILVAYLGSDFSQEEAY